MKLTTTIFLTLDGVYQSPGAPDEDPSGGFTHGGWQFPYADEDMGGIVTEWFEPADAFLLGRRTYDIFAAHWPRYDDPDDPIASKLNRLPKYVASRESRQFAWENSRPLGGELADAVGELKRAPGRELQVHGSGALVRELHDLGLIDEYRFLLNPVILGAGRKVFDVGNVPTALRLRSTRTTPVGAIATVYESAGVPTYGSLADG